jgi:molybdopterin/thiamine biosynthesis adenylyltransferase
VPELAPLQEKTVAVVGLGSLGAPAALALAQAGIGELRLIDHDWVDPGTSVRWPLGISEAGNIKTHSVSHFIAQNYPYTRIPRFPNELQKVLQEVAPKVARDNSPYPHPHGVGGYANPIDFDLLAEVFDGADVLLDTTGEENVQYFLGHFADRLGIPYVTVHGSFGGWGGAVFRRIPGSTSGCWWCLEKHLHEGNLPDPPGSKVEVQPLGCGDRTFTGAGFDMQTVALAAVRGVAEILSKYPSADWDLLVISFRDEKGRAIPPKFEGLRVPRHPACTACSEGNRRSGSAKVA